MRRAHGRRARRLPLRDDPQQRLQPAREADRVSVGAVLEGEIAQRGRRRTHERQGAERLVDRRRQALRESAAARSSCFRLSVVCSRRYRRWRHLCGDGGEHAHEARDCAELPRRDAVLVVRARQVTNGVRGSDVYPPVVVVEEPDDRVNDPGLPHGIAMRDDLSERAERVCMSKTYTDASWA